MKNYYEILGVEKGDEEEEIRRRYRKLAMEYHPDRNPGNLEAEARFKEIAEAYGVLTDPAKRKKYDACLFGGGGRRYRQQGGFTYSQEDILRDLFRDPQFQQMFQGLLREFQRSGLRAGPHFLRRSFFGGRGGGILGTLFSLGSVAGPLLQRRGKKALPAGKNLLKSISGALSGVLAGKKERQTESTGGSLDITYQTPVSAEDLQRGRWTEVVTTVTEGEKQVLRVKIPAGSRYGQKLRLRGKGRPGAAGRGDLYLQLCETQE